jgi:hypothetical protein
LSNPGTVGAPEVFPPVIPGNLGIDGTFGPFTVVIFVILRGTMGTDSLFVSPGTPGMFGIPGKLGMFGTPVVKVTMLGIPPVRLGILGIPV